MVQQNFFDVTTDVLTTLNLTDTIFVQCIPRDKSDKKFYMSAEIIGNPNGQVIFLAHDGEKKHFFLAKPLFPIPATISKTQDIKTISNSLTSEVLLQISSTVVRTTIWTRRTSLLSGCDLILCAVGPSDLCILL